MTGESCSELRDRLSRFPPGLRALVEAELANGNTIADWGGPPAPPAGDALRLAKPVTTRPRADGDGYTFYERNSSLWSGEFHDARRFYFVLEPPPTEEQLQPPAPGRIPATPAPATKPEHARASRESDTVERFRRSLEIDYTKWREGEGYDLEAIRTASPGDRRSIERLLSSRDIRDWRDVEALAQLGTPSGDLSLREVLRSGRAELRLAVLRHAPRLAPGRRFERILAGALVEVRPYEGLTLAIDLAAAHDTPHVRSALWLSLLNAPGDTACHFAGLLFKLHRGGDEVFDWNQRPLFLRFSGPPGPMREGPFRDLTRLCGVDPEATLAACRAPATRARARRPLRG